MSEESNPKEIIVNAHDVKEAVVFLIIFGGIFGAFAHIMGVSNMMSTLMNTAHDLLLNTVFFIMGVTVMAGALGKLFIEFKLIRVFEKLLAPLMRPLFNLPGCAALGGLMTFFSDNPAIISLAYDKRFSRLLKPVELVSLTNFGTAFGMGLIVISFMAGKGFFNAAMVGVFGTVVGAIVSTRLMQFFCRNHMGEATHNSAAEKAGQDASSQIDNFTTSNVADAKSPIFTRFLNAFLDGGKQGVELGFAIIPGVLIIGTAVMMFTKGPAANGLYTGAAYEGISFLPWIGKKLSSVFEILFGFKHPELIAFPVTSLGAVGAAMSLIPNFIKSGIITGNEIAVFTAMGMCWSGYLSTHTAMLDTLGFRHLTPKAILAHTIGGLVAGVVAHYTWISFF